MPVTAPVANVMNRFVFDAVSNIMSTLAEAIDEYANSRTSKQLMEFVERAAQGPNRSEVAQTHARLAKMMQESALASYDQAKGKFRKVTYDPARPQAGKRYGRAAQGAMRGVLSSGGLARSSANGVQFGDIAQLDRDAIQWYRLNFGAAPTGTATTERFPVRFGNLASEYEFDAQPDPGYVLPKGVWAPGGFPSAFYPRGEAKALGVKGGAFNNKVIRTKGNLGYHFLDAGVRRFFTELPIEYRLLFDKLMTGRGPGRPPAGFATHAEITARRPSLRF